MRTATNDPDDPLTRAMAPPPNETPQEREVRLRKEAEAQRVSDQIDEALRQERAALKKRKVVKMLLLGQSESGKSTTLKNMQLAYAPKAWAAERMAWRAVIQLNLIRSVNTILDALATELANSSPSSASPTPYSVRSNPPSPSPDDSSSIFSHAEPIAIPQDRKSGFMKLKLRLTPLRQVEVDLKTRLGAGTEEVTEASLLSTKSGSFDHDVLMATPFDDSSYVPPSRKINPKDIIVRSHKAWKEKERAWKLGRESSSRPMSAGSSLEAERDSASDVLVGCADDMKMLWQDAVVRDIVRKRKAMTGFGDSAEYFLNRISEIATRDYEPSDDDVLRARIRTLGVQEHTLIFEAGNERDMWKEWAVFDVGGSRTARAAWLPYFSDVNAVLFLAPISAFDERLAEDKRVNRLEDSFILWQSIVQSELLKKAMIILFMNKCDILEKKLLSGVMINKHMTSYGNRPNDAQAFSTYLKQKFKELHITLSPEKRPFYGYPTSVIDTDATASTLASVRDGILQAHLKSATFVA